MGSGAAAAEEEGANTSAESRPSTAKVEAGGGGRAEIKGDASDVLTTAGNTVDGALEVPGTEVGATTGAEVGSAEEPADDELVVVVVAVVVEVGATVEVGMVAAERERTEEAEVVVEVEAEVGAAVVVGDAEAVGVWVLDGGEGMTEIEAAVGLLTVMVRPLPLPTTALVLTAAVEPLTAAEEAEVVVEGEAEGEEEEEACTTVSGGATLPAPL